MRSRATRLIPAVAVVAFLSLWLAFGAPARADDAGTARDLFTQGNTFYDLGQFDKAIDAWQRGYQLKNDPGFLYNIGQAYRTMGDAEKAIFFYKRYLINAPKAKNRPEVEQKIEALQTQIDERQAPPAGLAPGATAAAPAEPPPSVTPPAAPAAAPPPSPPATTVPTAPPSAPPAESPAAPAVAPTAAEGAPVFELPRRIDVGLSLGFDTWSSGLRNHAEPSFAFAVDGGYTFGRPTASVRFRLGAIFSYTFLKETSSTESFLSFLIDPTVVIRVVDRARISADLGLGSVTITGLKPTSTLLATPPPGQMLKVNGAGVSRGVVRFGVAGEYDVMSGLSVFVWPAIVTSAKSGNFYGSLTRLEVLFGAAYRF
ncbi:MAG TPA: tetratricopeptide repeat protein [Polyangia bacterium]|nr:tetratricopeptide repeat protein [Polyangia bacterium]